MEVDRVQGEGVDSTLPEGVERSLVVVGGHSFVGVEHRTERKADSNLYKKHCPSE